MQTYTQIIDFRRFISYYSIWRTASRISGVAGRATRARFPGIAQEPASILAPVFLGTIFKDTCMLSRFAYRTTGLAIKTITNLSRAEISYHGENNIPAGSNIFVINHFTRLETFLMPYLIFRLTKIPVWSLASFELFKGAFGAYLEKVGAVSTKNPDRDRLIVKTLLTGEANWIIFPEGRMVKNKKLIEKGRYMISAAGGKHPPHTGAATLALRTEFYRQRIKRLTAENSDEARHLAELFQIQNLEPVINGQTHIVPVNLTYYPIRVRENILSNLAVRLVEDLPERIIEELMTEGSMLLSGVDIDIRFGKPIQIFECLQCSPIDLDISAKRRIHFDDPIPSRPRLRIEIGLKKTGVLGRHPYSAENRNLPAPQFTGRSGASADR
jgi:1-acyl-sn-glycerol-3-phosphate acyltransferase